MIFSCFRRTNIEKFEEENQAETYEEAAADFIDDYDRENPVT